MDNRQNNKDNYQRLDFNQVMMLEIARLLQNLQGRIEHYDSLQKGMYNEYLENLLNKMDNPPPGEMIINGAKQCKIPLLS